MTYQTGIELAAEGKDALALAIDAQQLDLLLETLPVEPCLLGPRFGLSRTVPVLEAVEEGPGEGEAQGRGRAPATSERTILGRESEPSDEVPPIRAGRTCRCRAPSSKC